MYSERNDKDVRFLVFLERGQKSVPTIENIVLGTQNELLTKFFWLDRFVPSQR